MDCPLVVIRGRLSGLPLEFQESNINIYLPTDTGTSDMTATYFAPNTKDFYKCRPKDIQLMKKLVKVGPGVPNPWNPTLDYVQDWIRKSQPTGETKPQPMRDDAILEGQYYTKPPASRLITHGSQANASTIPVICCMPSLASCQEAVHKGHFHTGIDLSSQYEQLWASSTTSLVHTIGFNNIQYAPLSAPQGSHHSPVQGKTSRTQPSQQ